MTVSLLELIFGAAELADDVRFGKRYGFGGFLWDLAGFGCLVVAFLFFRLDLNFLGVIGIIGAVVCLIFGIRRTWRDIKRTREARAKINGQEDGKHPCPESEG